MPKIAYIEKRFSTNSQRLIALSNTIIEQYQAQGYELTLRQLYYQLVARGHIPNNDREYKKLGSVIADARLAGLVDWDAIVDRTRNVRTNPHWGSPQEIMQAAIRSYAIDKWADQPWRPEVWIEKDALVGVIEPVCRRLDVSFFSCRGYTSASEMWSAGMRARNRLKQDQKVVIIHLGDHDPSGIDMTRDISDRLTLFANRPVRVRRIALNYDQIEQYSPPPNPAKITDSRSDRYIAEYGSESWELDALDPATLSDLIETTVLDYRDPLLWAEAVERETAERDTLRDAMNSLDI